MTGATYAEARVWVYWLRCFTCSELAESMGVTPESVEGFLVGLRRNGTILDTGDTVNGSGPREEILEIAPLPPGPTEHPHKAPEWQATPGVGELAPPNRGMPVRLMDDTKRRKQIQQSGGGRMHLVNRDRAYHRMQDAQRERAEKQREKAAVREGKKEARQAQKEADVSAFNARSREAARIK